MNFLTRLGISVQPYISPEELAAAAKHEAMMKALVIGSIVFVVVVAVVAGVFGKRIVKYFKQRKKLRAAKKISAQNAKELERLHEIKRKNKRK